MEFTIVELASVAATATVQAMAKDAWESTRDRVARMFGSDSATVADELEASRGDILRNQELVPLVEDEWRSRLARHLMTHPDAVDQLRELLDEVAPELAQGPVTNQIRGNVSGTAVQTGVLHGGVNTNYHGGNHQHGDPSSRINTQTEAELVHVGCSYNGGIELRITNSGSRPIRNVELVHLARADEPGESWKLNPNVWGARSHWDILQPGEKKQTFTWLLDAQGRHISNGSEIQAVVYTVRFVDYEGQWWERTPSGAHQVPPPA